MASLARTADSVVDVVEVMAALRGAVISGDGLAAPPRAATPAPAAETSSRHQGDVFAGLRAAEQHAPIGLAPPQFRSLPSFVRAAARRVYAGGLKAAGPVVATQRVFNQALVRALQGLAGWGRAIDDRAAQAEARLAALERRQMQSELRIRELERCLQELAARAA